MPKDVELNDAITSKSEKQKGVTKEIQQTKEESPIFYLFEISAKMVTNDSRINADT